MRLAPADHGGRFTAERRPSRDRARIAKAVGPAIMTVRDRCNGHGLSRLVKRGVVLKDGNRLVLPPEKTLLGLWDDYRGRSDVAVRDATFFPGYIRTRVTLDVAGLEHPDWVLRAFIQVFGKENVRKDRVRKVLGAGALDDAYSRLCAMIGRKVKPTPPRRKATEDEFYALLPDRTRDAFRRHLSRPMVPPIQPLDPHHMARVLSLAGDGLRLMAAAALINTTANRRSKSNAAQLVLNAEVASELLADVDHGDETAIEAALLALLGSDGSDNVVGPAVRDWFRLQRAARSVAMQVLGDDAGVIIGPLPAFNEPSDAVGKLLSARMKRVKNPKTAVDRADRVADIVARLIDVQAAVENRVYQLEQIMKACDEAIPESIGLLDAGLEAGFAWEGPVIRPDGSLGAGHERHQFHFVREGTLFERAFARSADPSIERHMPGSQGHKPLRWNRLHVVYAGTEPVESGGECHEPFFVRFFRWGVFDTDRRAAAYQDVRLEILRKLDHRRVVSLADGLLGSSRHDRVVANYARGVDPASGDIVIPLMNLYHAMAYARVALRFGIRWGARIGETMQLRVGCIVPADIRRGNMSPYVELQPKGWVTMGRFGMDMGTARAIAAVRAFTNVRWHGRRRSETGQPWLPTVACGIPGRILPPAAYLFQTAGRAVRTAELTLAIKVLLFGVVDFLSHDGRRVFATALGLDGEGYETIGTLLHHTPESAMPARYDFSAMIVADDAAERFNASMDARELGVAAGG